MAVTLQSPRPAARLEEFAEKQLTHARRRIRQLDFFGAGLALLLGSLLFMLLVLIIDRKFETPSGTGWAVLAGYLVLAGGYLWITLFRPSRRQINPFFAAHQVEMTIPDAKNSLVNYVDLKDDPTLPASVKAAIGNRAGKELKRVDLQQTLQKKSILYLGGMRGCCS